MQEIQSLIPNIPDAVPSSGNFSEDITDFEVRIYNEREGNLSGFPCGTCKNKGYVAFRKENEMMLRECDCMKVRRAMEVINESGLERQLCECTFDSYEVSEPWQKQLKSAAENFARSDAQGFFIGGQTGCGKTHLCTAIVGKMIKRGMAVRYFVWREDSTVLKSLVNDPEYLHLMQAYKQTDCLYIDDLFKQEEIRDADIRLAFELIDYRCRNRKKTIISTELTEEHLIRTDEALAGRIFQMSKGFRLTIPKDRRKNYRLR